MIVKAIKFSLVFFIYNTLIFTVGCQNRDQVPRVDFYLDLSQSEYAQLLNIGGFVIVNNIIVANKDGANYLALTGYCTQHICNLSYQISSHEFICTCNVCRFAEDGSINMGPATQPLTTYLTLRTGNMLRVYESQ